MIRRGVELLLKRRDFGLLMATQFLAQAGDGVVQGALGKAITFGGQRGFDLEGAATPEELLRIALYLLVPYTIISPFLGVVIDRWDRRRLLFLANGLRGAVVVLIAVAIASGMAPSSLPVFLAFLLTLMSTRVVLATKAAAIPVTLGSESLVAANSVSQLGGAIFQLGGFAVALVGTGLLPAWPVALAGGGVYVAGAAVALAIRRAGEPRRSLSLAEEVKRVIARIVAGIREVIRTPKAAASISTYFWLRLLWSYTLVGIGFVARRLLESDTAIAVLTGGAGALGASLGFLLAHRLTERAPSSAHVVVGSSILAGAGVTVLGGIQARASIAVLAFFLGLGFFLAKISLDTMVQESLGDDFRGRAFSLYDIAYNLAWVVAATVMFLAWEPGRASTLVVAMGAVFLAGVVGLAAWYRKAGLFREAAVAETPAPAAS